METHSEEHVLNGHSEPKTFLVSLGVNDLPNVWGAIEPVLSKACADSRGEFTIPGILHNMGLNDGVEMWRLLAIVRGDELQAVMVVCVTQLDDGCLSLDCLLAGGDRAKDWVKVDPEFDAFARQRGCRKVRIPRARTGWPQILPHWRITGVWLEPIKEEEKHFAAICIPRGAARMARRALRWATKGYVMEREI